VTTPALGRTSETFFWTFALLRCAAPRVDFFGMLGSSIDFSLLDYFPARQSAAEQVLRLLRLSL
jgi:hypothetical protein